MTHLIYWGNHFPRLRLWNLPPMQISWELHMFTVPVYTVEWTGQRRSSRSAVIIQFRVIPPSFLILLAEPAPKGERLRGSQTFFNITSTSPSALGRPAVFELTSILPGLMFVAGGLQHPSEAGNLSSWQDHSEIAYRYSRAAGCKKNVRSPYNSCFAQKPDGSPEVYHLFRVAFETANHWHIIATFLGTQGLWALLVLSFSALLTFFSGDRFVSLCARSWIESLLGRSSLLSSSGSIGSSCAAGMPNMDG